MKETLKIILILFFIFLVIGIALIVLINVNNLNKKNEENIANNITINNTTINDTSQYTPLEKDNSYSIYYQMNQNIKEYFEKIDNNKNLELYYTIDEEYREKNNITQDNILNNLKKYKNINNFQIYEVYKKVETSAKVVCFVKCMLQSSEYVYFIYATDAAPKVEEFEEPRYILYMCTEEEYNNYVSGRLEYKKISLENNGYNIGTLVNYNDEDISRKFFIEFNSLIAKEPEKTYELLNKEYKNKKFPTYDIYLKYIKRNNLMGALKQIVSQNLTKGYATTQAVIEDKDKNTYIMNFDYKQYDIMLDNYTIMSDDEKKEYNGLTGEQKAGKQAERFINMINDRDYYQAYSKLSDQFKEKYFQTQEKFEEYINKNIFQGTDKFDMVLDKQEVEKDGDIYFVKVRLTAFGATLEDNIGDKGIKLIIKLQGNEDFVMSFEI